MSSFSDYAPYYDLFYRGKDYAAESSFVLDVLGSHGCRPRSILELGCGTGGHAEHFAKAGCSVLGVDLSERMVARAVERFAALPDQLSGRFRGLQADVSEFKSAQKFDAVVSLFHVASYQTTNEALRGYFASASSVLNPGGIFFFDFWYGPAVLCDPPQVKERREKADDGTEVLRHTRPRLRENDNVVEVDFRFLLQGEGAKAEFGEIHPMRYLFLPEISMFSQAVGLKVEQASQWMTLAPLGRGTWYGCVVLRKMSGTTNP